MIRTLRSKVAALLVIAACSATVAKAYEGHAPIQAFIDRERSEHDFIVVSNLWHSDNSFTTAQTAKYVRTASFFSLDRNGLSKVMTANNRDISLSVPKPGGGTFTISLGQYAPFTGGFEVLANDGHELTPYN